MIKQYLEGSTGHITEDDNVILELNKHGWPVSGDEYGWWIWVPDDPRDVGNTSWFDRTGLSQALWKLICYARANGCAYIRLDQDADPIPDLPFFEW